MNRVLLFLILTFTKVTSNVTNRTQIAEPTTQIFVENGSEEYVPHDLSEKKENSETVKEDGTGIYLDDVLFTLMNQEWSAEEKPCLDDIYRMLYSLQNFTLWAVWDWDAQSSEPQGLLFANRYQLGNFDQCMNAPWSETHKELSTKYCLADIVLKRTDRSVRKKVENPYYPYQSALDYIQYHRPHSRPFNEITWGACVPSSCGPQTVETLLGVMLSRSHLGSAGIKANISITESCQTKDDRKQFNGLYYGFWAFIGILVLISITCTYVNNKNKRLDAEKISTELIKAFCIRENAVNLLSMKKEGLEVFYGIKYLTICLIVLDHQIAFYNSGPISDGVTSDEVTKSVLGMLILHDDLFVDTMFLLSGFLCITYTSKIKRLPNPLLIFLKRYVRLVVALAVVVFYICAVYPYTGSGPLWNRHLAADHDTCLENWWLNLLMVNNYVNSERMCLVPSWYIPCDFHFFIMTILIYSMYKKSQALGLICGSIVTILAIVLPGVITYMYNFEAIQLFTIEFITNPRASREFNLIYIKSHTRFASYLVGVFSGFIFIKYNGNLKRIPKTWATTGAIAGLLLMLAVLMSGSYFLWWDYHPLEGALYAALNRPAWSCGVALLVFCCVFGQVPIVKAFLTWYPWVPLSRLSYGLYLTHSIIILRNVFTTRNPQHNDYFEILNTTTGVIFWSCLASLFLWIFFEAPANKLLTICLKSRIKKFKESQETAAPTTTVTPNGSGNLQENLASSNIQISSKM